MTWTTRFAAVGRTCVRELLYMAVVVTLTLVNLQQRILPDICAVAQQQHEQQLSGAAPDMGPYRGLCSNEAPAPYLSRSWPAAIKAIASFHLQGLAGLLVSHHCQHGALQGPT
jgi:hypothetical protein